MQCDDSSILSRKLSADHLVVSRAVFQPGIVSSVLQTKVVLLPMFEIHTDTHDLFYQAAGWFK